MNSIQKKWFIIIAVVLAFNGAIWFLGIDPARTSIAQVERQISAQEQKETQLLGRLATLEAIDIEALEQEREDQLVLIPNPGLLREIMTELEEMASQTENELIVMNLNDPSQVDIFQSMQISLSMSGDYHSLYSYIKYLETHSRLIIVNNFTLSNPSEGEMAANIQLELFSDNFDPYTPHEAPGRDNPFSAQ